MVGMPISSGPSCALWMWLLCMSLQVEDMQTCLKRLGIDVRQ